MTIHLAGFLEAYQIVRGVVDTWPEDQPDERRGAVACSNALYMELKRRGAEPLEPTLYPPQTPSETRRATEDLNALIQHYRARAKRLENDALYIGVAREYRKDILELVEALEGAVANLSGHEEVYESSTSSQ